MTRGKLRQNKLKRTAVFRIIKCPFGAQTMGAGRG
jgi:hypothetical protein